MNTISVEIPRGINDMSRGDLGRIWKALQKLTLDINRELSSIGRDRLAEELVYELNQIGQNLSRIEEVEEQIALIKTELDNLKASGAGG